jgi:hypothetical protein
MRGWSRDDGLWGRGGRREGRRDSGEETLPILASSKSMHRSEKGTKPKRRAVEKRKSVHAKCTVLYGRAYVGARERVGLNLFRLSMCSVESLLSLSFFVFCLKTRCLCAELAVGRFNRCLSAPWLPGLKSCRLRMVSTWCYKRISALNRRRFA